MMNVHHHQFLLLTHSIPMNSPSFLSYILSLDFNPSSHSLLAMAEVELQAVLQFFRKNGLSECESALMEDIMDKSQLCSSLFESLCFPMPPPLKIPPTRRPPPPLHADGGGDSSDDEFVSLGSSNTDLYSSDFTNPYGIHTTRPASQASSDRMSQFGTARDYPDFDMQNDMLWYKENDEDYVMPPLFDGRDFDGDPSEDKFVMSMQPEDPVDDETKYNIISEGRKRWALAPTKILKCEPGIDCDEVDENFQHGKNNRMCEEHCNDYSCSAPLCACCNGIEEVYTGDPADHSSENRKIIDVCNCELAARMKGGSSAKIGVVGSDDTHNFNNVTKQSQLNERDDYTSIDDEAISGELHEAVPDKEAGAISDELLTYAYDKQDDYEIFNLRIIHRKNRTGFEEDKEFPIVLNSVIAGRYHVMEILGSAAFSRVVQAHDLYSGMEVCLKIIKNDKDFFDQSLDEIKLLKFVNKSDPADQHHILRLYDYFYHQEHLFIVTELLRANLYEFQKYNRESGAEPYFTMQRLQVITQQCLEALLYLHDLGIVHCDLKPENILIKSYGRCEIKVIDLGSSCFETDNLSLYVQSRSYRAPEVMLGLPYDQKIDLWSVGCILAELYSGEVLFPNEAVVLLLARMIAMLGPIDVEMLRDGHETHKYFTKEYDLYYIDEDSNEVEYIIPEETLLEEHLQIFDHIFVDFIKYLLEINPTRRPTAQEALKHPWLSHRYEI